MAFNDRFTYSLFHIFLAIFFLLVSGALFLWGVVAWHVSIIEVGLLVFAACCAGALCLSVLLAKSIARIGKFAEEIAAGNFMATPQTCIREVRSLMLSVERLRQGIAEHVEALNRSQALLAKSQEIAHVGSWELELATHHLAWSDEVYRIFGVRVDEFPHTLEGFFEFVHPDDRAAVDAAFQSSLREQRDGYEVEHRIVRKQSGEVRYVREKCIHVRDENHKIVRSVGMVQDITEAKYAEEALERRLFALTRPIDDPNVVSFEHLFNIADIQRLQDDFAQATGVASIITNPHGAPITKPSNFCRLCNEIIRNTRKGRANCYRSDAIIGQPSTKGPTIQPCMSCGLWDAGAAISVGGRHIANWLIGQVRDVTQNEERMRLYAREIEADEEVVVQAFREVPAMSRERFGQVAQVLFTLANQLSAMAYQNMQQARFITDRQRAETEREKLRGQLMQAQKMESVGRLAGGVAHDFNNMLGVILGRAEMALKRVDPAQKVFHDLQEIRGAAERSANLTRQLLAFARKQTVLPKLLDLNKTVESMLEMLRHLIGEDIELVLVSGVELGAVKIDPTQIDQVLANLCVNARDAIRGVGKITIRTENVSIDMVGSMEGFEIPPGRYVTLSVSDTGCGMDKATIEKLFEPFFTTKDVGRGTGLGLATVYGIVKQNNGYIQVQSDVGKGSSFTIYLPQHTEELATEPLEEALPRAGLGRTETILLVEDEPSFLQMTKAMLESLGYGVLAVSSPEEAVSLVETGKAHVDLLISDVIMPQMNGRQLAEKLSALIPSLTSLFMSGYTADVIAHHGVLGDDVLFIQKPFLINELARKVREALTSAG